MASPDPSIGGRSPVASSTRATVITPLADAVNGALPQTQCTRCGFPDCRGYAEAIAAGDATIDRCPPGGAEGIARLAALTGQPARPLDPVHGVEAPRRLAVIDEAWCIGCTLCLAACPVDCIVGAPKLMHTVDTTHCTGCELCLPACPVDCISMQAVPGSATGWAAWSQAQADDARDRYAFHVHREARERLEKAARFDEVAAGVGVVSASAAELTPGAAPSASKSAAIQAALARARAARAG